MGFIALEKSRRTVCCGWLRWGSSPALLAAEGLESPVSRGRRFRSPAAREAAHSTAAVLVGKTSVSEFRKKKTSGEKCLPSQEDFLLFSEGFIMFL